MIKINLPYNTRLDNSLLPTTGIVVEIPDDIDASISYTPNGTFSIDLNEGCDCNCGDTIDNVVSLPQKPKVESRDVIAPKVGGKVG